MIISFQAPAKGYLILQAFLEALKKSSNRKFRWRKHEPIPEAPLQGEVVYRFHVTGVKRDHFQSITFHGENFVDGTWVKAWEYIHLGSFELLEINPFREYTEIPIRWGSVMPDLGEREILKSCPEFKVRWEKLMKDFLFALSKGLRVEGLREATGQVGE